ncbi:MULTISPECIES: class I SAM-dependent methyltransferase [unclassified Caballeronia]|uniref:class I SAM-dependent methyltransferase n=1 Tax=unclassified Caballeronia TaxID=2646786 RepID=UPI002027DAF0|nr:MULTISPECIES: class I SAM-dependent methyltransferase [unclassified Caballeronia]
MNTMLKRLQQELLNRFGLTKRSGPSPWPADFIEEYGFLDQFADATLVPEGVEHSVRALNQTGFIGRNAAIGRPAANVYGSLSPLLAQRKFKVVCFFTSDNEYAGLAARLKECLDRFNVEYEFDPIQSFGAWELNCAYKARFIRDKWLASEVPIVWLDADATVEASPDLFATLDADFAVHKWHGKTASDQGWQFASGTIFFGKTDLAGKLIDQWLLRCEADPETWDQEHLCSAWCDISSVHPLKTVWLPRSYLQIADAAEFSAPVVRHWQASRSSKTDGRALHTRAISHTEAGIRDRLDNRLWRTVEEGFWISEGTRHIKPEIGLEYPEGFDVGRVLRDTIGGKFPVLEVGCGVGRIAALFNKDEYIGVDINPNAVSQARKALPGHRIRITDHGIEYPDAPTAMIYTVLLHVSDEAIPSLLEEIVKRRERVVIAELMDTRWRRDGDPPVFNRNAEDYILLMDSLGFAFSAYQKLPYQRYENQGRPQDTRITFLRFDRK